MNNNTLTPELLEKMDAYWLAVMTVLNDLARFHLVTDTIDRLPQTGTKGDYLKQEMEKKLVEHRQYIDKNGIDMPEIRNWRWR